MSRRHPGGVHTVYDGNCMDFLRRLTDSIKAKLFFCFLLMSLVALFAGGMSMIPFRNLENSLLRIGHGNLQSLLRISTIKEALSEIVAAERTLLIRQLSDLSIRNQSYGVIRNAYREASEASEGFEDLGLTPGSWRSGARSARRGRRARRSRTSSSPSSTGWTNC